MQLLRVRVNLAPAKRIARRMYTAKLVKRLLIAAYPALEEWFRPSSGPRPKLLHITPLYIENGKRKTIHYTDRVEPGAYTFYMGFAEELLDHYTLYEHLLGLQRTSFAGATVYVEVFEISRVDVYAAAAAAAESARRSGKFKLVFASPTILRDPLVRTKHKTLVPATINIFSTPVYTSLYLETGKPPRTREVLKQLIAIHKAFTVPPTFWQTLRKIDLTYEPGRRIPALIGYLNLHYNPDYDENGDTLTLMQHKILPTMLALGTGVGRAAGYGHIEASPVSSLTRV